MEEDGYLLFYRSFSTSEDVEELLAASGVSFVDILSLLMRMLVFGFKDDSALVLGTVEVLEDVFTPCFGVDALLGLPAVLDLLLKSFYNYLDLVRIGLC